MSGPEFVAWLVRAAFVYAVAGIVFAAAFCARGASAIDPSARGATWGFRAAIFPGVAAFWPLLAFRWLSGARTPPEERTSHKVAARGRAS